MRMAGTLTNDRIARETVTDGNPNLPRAAVHFGDFADSRPREEAEDGCLTIWRDILDAVGTQSSHLTDGLSPAFPSHRRWLDATLGVISYCYVKGIFESTEIEYRLWQDPKFLAAFGDSLPTAQAIRAFRRRYRAVILATIEKALILFQHRTQKLPEASAVDVSVGTETGAIHEQAEHLLEMAGIMDQLDTGDD
jgi:hypothetical protein